MPLITLILALPLTPPSLLIKKNILHIKRNVYIYMYITISYLFLQSARYYFVTSSRNYAAASSNLCGFLRAYRVSQKTGDLNFSTI